MQKIYAPYAEFKVKSFDKLLKLEHSILNEFNK